MASNQRATQEKRRRERAKQEAHLEKAQARLVRKERKRLRDESLRPGEDPDLIGIFPGPQPNPETDSGD